MRLVCKAFYKKFKIRDSLQYVTITIMMTVSFFKRITGVLFVDVCGGFLVLTDVFLDSDDGTYILDQYFFSFIRSKLSEESDGVKTIVVNVFLGAGTSLDLVHQHFDQLVPKLLGNLIDCIGHGSYCRRFNVFHVLELNVDTDVHVVWEITNGVEKKHVFLEVVGLRYEH